MLVVHNRFQTLYVGLGKIKQEHYDEWTDCLQNQTISSLETKLKDPCSKPEVLRFVVSKITINYSKGGKAMQVSEIINNQKDPIANSLLDKSFNPIGNRKKTISSVVVDKLLADYADLIDPSYQKWFAARFYKLPFDQIHRAASEARHDGKNSQRLFSFIINRMYKALA